ncbi:hypothetical protein EJ06DRAFT_357615 [Trichodelitschia bisporula]|uniref:Uncharacterized protein n=1 Tax=Trichodelitschia bisporula TaxID=703511 RepID=A0A6G1I0T8_9PEZI|nr:hypothetical protein EJ06DRAFT_357615 [Trichodelitschia bisporula]
MAAGERAASSSAGLAGEIMVLAHYCCPSVPTREPSLMRERISVPSPHRHLASSLHQQQNLQHPSSVQPSLHSLRHRSCRWTSTVARYTSKVSDTAEAGSQLRRSQPRNCKPVSNAPCICSLRLHSAIRPMCPAAPPPRQQSQRHRRWRLAEGDRDHPRRALHLRTWDDKQAPTDAQWMPLRRCGIWKLP